MMFMPDIKQTSRLAVGWLTVELSCQHQLAGLFAPPKAF
jgi:hypothetical protein